MFNTKNACKERSKSVSTARMIQLVAIFVIAVSFILRPDLLSGIELCAFHALTGLQCPGCGMTRAFCAISHGQFADAWKLNPVSFYFYTLTILGLVYPLFVNIISDRIIRIIVLVTITIPIIFGIFRVLRDI